MNYLEKLQEIEAIAKRQGITDQTRIPQIGNKEVQQIRAELEAKDRTIQSKDDRIQELDGIVTEDVHEISRLNHQVDVLKELVKTVDDFSVGELLAALVRKLGVK